MPSLPPCPVADPGDDDLTGVVTHLSALTTRSGQVPRDPNEPEVRWLLEAGLRALGENVLHRTSSDGPLAYTNANGLFDALPVDRVMLAFREMTREAGLDVGSANKARLIRRWSFAANYQLDLVAYLFRPSVHAARIARAQDTLRAALPHLTFSQVVDHLTAQESTLAPMASIYRLQHVMRMMFPTDETIRRYAAALYDVQMKRWAPLYAEVAAAYRLPGLHGADPPVFTDLAPVLGLVVEGAFVRSTSLQADTARSDGTPTAVAAARAVIAAAAGVPWHDLADLRVDDSVDQR